MAKLKYYLKSMRLRTLPLSLAGVLLGSLLAVADYKVRGIVVLLVCLTTVCLQILSNLSNELGDVLHGTDNADRQGPQYGLNSGNLTVRQMKGCIGAVLVLCCISGIAMIWVSFGTLLQLEPVCLIMLGAAAIIAAMRYTLGRNPYGYRALGDLYVFIFFGLVSVLGAYFVCAHTVSGWLLLLPASTIGFFSMGVLNTNNIRDMATDAPNRITVAVKLGLHNARIYQTVLIFMGWACMTAFCLMRIADWRHWLWVVTLPLFATHLRGVWTHTERALDKYLPMLVMSSFIFALLAGLGFCAYLI
ncbi:MAG: 1,4-dihydroxy-2-naphthoate octaprenyltransferase [Bacteroidales bacterium]|nr:1,4-dihydroxy-2-naphthoate octaprenyltransferase [Bacteroidales bacterium]